MAHLKTPKILKPTRSEKRGPMRGPVLLWKVTQKRQEEATSARSSRRMDEQLALVTSFDSLLVRFF